MSASHTDEKVGAMLWPTSGAIGLLVIIYVADDRSRLHFRCAQRAVSQCFMHSGRENDSHKLCAHAAVPSEGSTGPCW